MTTRVLFLCPHAAGKSVFAATYFRAAAARRGIDVIADVAGTDPDGFVMPDVRAALETQGFVIVDTPRAVSVADLEGADIVVSIGCEHGEVPFGDIVEWEVPMLSENFVGSMNGIHDLAEELALGLEAV